MIVVILQDGLTTSVLSFVPEKEDDGSSYSCRVWNRAMKKNDFLSSVTSTSFPESFSLKSVTCVPPIFIPLAEYPGARNNALEQESREELQAAP